MRRHFGLRPSRSYDLLSDAHTDSGTPKSYKQPNGRCLADGDWRTQSSYGVSPRYKEFPSVHIAYMQFEVLRL